MTKETGGPAFPITTENHINFGGLGMTLRDYFAAKAMAGYLTGDAILKDADTADEWLTKTAKASYEMADKMLKARQE